VANFTFLPTKDNERIKIYIVIGLSLVLVALAYFRFVHKKPKRSRNVDTATATEPATQFELLQPEKAKLKNTQQRESIVREPKDAVIRDIFAPLKSLPRASRLAKKGASSNRGGSLQLKGVIIGGKNPIAIINDKLVRNGERIGDYTVVRVEKKQVFLRSANRNIRLTLENNE
jgi:hypothetical protein